jgi:hypothetical protein
MPTETNFNVFYNTVFPYIYQVNARVRQDVAGLSLRKFRFNSRLVHVGFMAGN